MITYEKFKELFDLLDSDRTPEIEIYFENTDDVYMIVKHNDYVDFGKCGLYVSSNENRNFANLDELYNSEVDGIFLKRDWNKVSDILIDLAFSVVDDKEELEKVYGVELWKYLKDI